MVDPVSMELLSDAVVLVTADDYRKLQVENIRLTRELDEAKAEIEERRLDGQRRCACEFEEGAIRPVVECLVHRTWRRVDSEPPVLAGSVLAFYPECGNSVAGPVQRIYYSPSLKQPWGGSDCTGAPTHWMPLPAAPNEAGK